MFIFARHDTQEEAVSHDTQLPISRARVEEILARARGVRLAVLGDCMLDVYLTGGVARISPEAPVPVVEIDNERSAPGGAANVAAGVVALGARCELIGVVGTDAAAEQLRAVLTEIGVSTDRIIECEGRRTTVKTRVMARHQHVVRFDRESRGEVDGEVAERIMATMAELGDAVDAVVLEDYDKGVLAPSVIRSVIDAARRHSIPSVADPKLRHFFEFRGVDVFKPNAAELATALGVQQVPRNADQLCEARQRVGCGHLLLTLAEEGILVLGPDGDPRHIRAVAREVFDVSGAGDTVTAVVATCLAAGASVHEAATVANYAAGVAVGKAGVVPVRAEEIVSAVEPYDHGDA